MASRFSVRLLWKLRATAVDPRHICRHARLDDGGIDGSRTPASHRYSQAMLVVWLSCLLQLPLVSVVVLADELKKGSLMILMSAPVGLFLILFLQIPIALSGISAAIVAWVSSRSAMSVVAYSRLGFWVCPAWFCLFLE